MLDTFLERSVFRLHLVLDFHAVINHPVESECQLTNFIPRNNRRTGRVITRSDFLDRVSELSHRTGDRFTRNNPHQTNEQKQHPTDSEDDEPEMRGRSQCFGSVNFRDNPPIQTVHRQWRVGTNHVRSTVATVLGFRGSPDCSGLSTLGFNFEQTDCALRQCFTVRA